MSALASGQILLSPQFVAGSGRLAADILSAAVGHFSCLGGGHRQKSILARDPAKQGQYRFHS